MLALTAGVTGWAAHIRADLPDIFAFLIVRGAFGRRNSFYMTFATVHLLLTHGCLGEWPACEVCIPDIGGVYDNISG